MSQKVQALTAASVVTPVPPSIEDEENDKQQFFFAKSDNVMIKDSHPVKSEGKQPADALPYSNM